MKLKNPVALVTGASSGIGKATAERLATAGYKVYGTSRRGATPGQRPFEMLSLDVTSDESVAAAVGTLLRSEGRVDLLVNNAGFSVAPAGAEESSIEQARSIFDTNFFGIVRMTRAVVPHMRQQGGGRIINIGSVLGFLPAPYMALYAATKHALEGYSESLDHELRTRGIRVAVIEPAYTKTDFDANLLEPDAKLEEYRQGRATVTRQLRAVLETADDPGIVAAVVLEAASASRPRLRYTAGRLANRLRLLRRFAPAGVVDAGLRKDLRLDVHVASLPHTAAVRPSLEGAPASLVRVPSSPGDRSCIQHGIWPGRDAHRKLLRSIVHTEPSRRPEARRILVRMHDRASHWTAGVTVEGSTRSKRPPHARHRFPLA